MKTITKQDLTLYRGDRHVFVVQVNFDEEAVDLSGATLIFTIAPSMGEPIVVHGAASRDGITIVIDSEQTTNATWRAGKYDLRAVFGDGVMTLCYGKVSLIHSVGTPKNGVGTLPVHHQNIKATLVQGIQVLHDKNSQDESDYLAYYLLAKG